MQADLRFPLAAVMECRHPQPQRWSLPVWNLVGFVAGHGVSGEEPRRLMVHRVEDHEQWLWTGLRLCLFRDRAESYWYNLTGRRPVLFLICREQAPGVPEPYSVSADFDEAAAHLEADDLVYSAPLPPELHVRLETFVMDHYRPTPSHRRKRTRWAETPDHGWKPSPRLARS